jgi:hypothetical protein
MYSPEYTELHRPRSFTTLRQAQDTAHPPRPLHAYLGSPLPFSDVRVAPPKIGGQFVHKRGVVCSPILCYLINRKYATNAKRNYLDNVTWVHLPNCELQGPQGRISGKISPADVHFQ